MNNYKGTGAVFVRKLIASRGPEFEQRFLARLNPAEVAIYHQTFEFDWIPIEVITRFFEVAAPLLYPGQMDGLRMIGQQMARDNLRDIYRILLRVATVPFIIGQSARLWQTYHRKGRAVLERSEPNLMRFVVRDYPDLPERFRECLCGYIMGLMELVAARDIRVLKYSDAPEAWSWKIAWR